MSELSDSVDVHALEDLQLQSLWVLDYYADTKDRLSASEIANHLVENCGIATSRQAVRYAVEKEKRLVHKNKNGYKIMQPGRRKLSAEKAGKVIMIDAGKPFSAKNVVIKTIFDSLKSSLMICDPYIDVSTLDILFRNVDKNKQVKILTQKIGEKPAGSFSRHLFDLRHEGFQVEIRIYSKSDLHDRYFLDSESFWLSGNSLNHIGNKESFIVKLGEDIRQSMQEIFDRRWKVSTII